jgi:hypothetical protein
MSRIAAVLLCLSLLGETLVAHHGTQVSYQIDKMITLKGTVTEWAFAYPHPQIYFDVMDANGKVQHWAAELLPTPIMMRNMKVGWDKNSLRPGDQIVLVGNPSKVSLATVILARKLTVNGKEMQLGNAAPGNESGTPPPLGKD